jgi:hypothetical protein
MKNPPPINQLYPEDHVQQFHNSHMFVDDGNHPTALGSVLRHGHMFASGGAVADSSPAKSEMIDKALQLTRKART